MARAAQAAARLDRLPEPFRTREREETRIAVARGRQGSDDVPG